jgi:hypothetical protein
LAPRSCARRSALLLAAVTAVGACSPGPSPSLSAELTQYRRDQPLLRVQVKLSNEGDTDLVVESLRLAARGFAPLPHTETDATLRPGVDVDLPVPHGAVDCEVAVPAGITDGTAVARVRVGDGEAQEVRVPLPSKGQVLALVRRRECDRQALEEAVDLSFSDAWPEEVAADGRPVLRPTLVLRRRGGEEPVRVTEAGGHVLFTVTPRSGDAAPALMALERGASEVELPLDVVTTRCDGHALAESKRTPLFLFYVAVGTSEPRALAVAAPAAVHGRLSEFATRSCRG